MRGSHKPEMSMWQLIGIIPAHAGLTACRHPALHYSRDHPRACGAHTVCSTCLYACTGSSPRMRGSRLVVVNPIVQVGIIPAHAGLTAIAKANRKLSRDHPRACGAHEAYKGAKCIGVGSSPRMRGSRRRAETPTQDGGIIPAHAGLTISPWFTYTFRRGSSPRMRGSL